MALYFQLHFTFISNISKNIFSCASSFFQIGLTPLHIAAEKGHADFVRVLVTKYNAIIDPFTVVSFTVVCNTPLRDWVENRFYYLDNHGNVMSFRKKPFCLFVCLFVCFVLFSKTTSFPATSLLAGYLGRLFKQSLDSQRPDHFQAGSGRIRQVC